MGPTLSPETSAFKLQKPGKFPEEYKLQILVIFEPPCIIGKFVAFRNFMLFFDRNDEKDVYDNKYSSVH